MVSQRQSHASTQLDLPVFKPAARVAHDLSGDVISLLPRIRNIPTLHRSIEFARELSGKQDKQIYDEVGIDAGAFARMKAGSAWYPQDERWQKILNKIGEIPLAWMCESRGYDFSTLRKHQTSLEQQLEAANQRIRELEHDREVEQRVIAQLIGGRK
jgi:hypothetical protein